MKLYTKEMFLIAAEKCEVSMIDAKHIMQYIDEYVTAIELSTYQDIDDKSLDNTDKKLHISDFSDSDYVKDLSFIIDKYRQDFLLKIQYDVEDILGNKIIKKLIYSDKIYYEIDAKNRKFHGFFDIYFDKSKYGNEYCGIIYFDNGGYDGHEFFKKSSLIKILQSKKLL